MSDDMIVVGGGLAGLVAARELSHAGGGCAWRSVLDIPAGGEIALWHRRR